MHDFFLEYRVPYADTDQMGVVYYANFLIFFERARNEFFRKIEYPYLKMEDEGIMLPVVEAHVDYASPALYDDLLKITARVVKLKGCRIQMENEVYNEQGVLICKGYTVHCFMGKESRKPMKAPDSLIKQIESMELK
jgi:acyl-CoA thioester hydrolase